MFGQSEWVETNQPTSIAPYVHKPPSRPPKQRKRDLEEPRNPYRVSRMNKTIKCRKCQKEGHNTRGCKAGIIGGTPWQRRDRLAKSKAVRRDMGFFTISGTSAFFYFVFFFLLFVIIGPSC